MISDYLKETLVLGALAGNTPLALTIFLTDGDVGAAHYNKPPWTVDVTLHWQEINNFVDIERIVCTTRIEMTQAITDMREKYPNAELHQYVDTFLKTGALFGDP